MYSALYVISDAALQSPFDVAEMHPGNNNAGLEKYEIDLTVSKGSEEDFFTTTTKWTLGFNSYSWSLSGYKTTEHHLDVWKPLCWRFGSNQNKVARLHLSLRPGHLGGLCAVIEDSPPSGEHTQKRAVIERSWRRTGSGPEGSGPVETQSFDVEWEERSILWKGKTFCFSGRWVARSFQRVLTTSRVILF